MTTGQTALDLAAARLDRALTSLEQKLADDRASSGGLFDQDNSKLAAELAASKARERELEAAAKDASVAVANAIEQIQGVLADKAQPAEA